MIMRAHGSHAKDMYIFMHIIQLSYSRVLWIDCAGTSLSRLSTRQRAAVFFDGLKRRFRGVALQMLNFCAYYGEQVWNRSADKCKDLVDGPFFCDSGFM